ncbi:MAG: SusC/RagA family TonB-linked outer membrane protein [Chlorobi bacterium]|nr:SusC/RagA family TonB-linked outer membrane protein [Chlorobiota bacterium]
MKKLMLLFAIFSILGLQVYAQNTVTGKVLDDSGESLPGVTVLVKGTTITTMTLGDGTYSIDVPDGSNTLVFSYIGMETQEAVITGNVIDVTLKPTSQAIDEVVVTAYGIVREKRETTYQTSKVSNDELNISAPTRAAAGLVGKVAGLQINIQDNGVNPNSQILLRGLRSISGGNEALIVIDGSIATQGAFNDLNPNDVASITVLKGATAAALYGSDASNGALIVTTKKGNGSGKLTVGISSNATLEQVAYMPKFQTQYGTGWEGAYDPIENTNWGPRFDGTVRQIGPTFPADWPVPIQMVPYAPYKDNLKDFFQTGNTFSNTVYLTGGSKTSKFYMSFGDQRSKGIVIDDAYRRNTVRVNASKTLGKVELSTNISFLNDHTDVVGSTIGTQDRPLYWYVLNTSANVPLPTYWDWQNPLSYGYKNNYNNGYYQNPYMAIGTNRNIDNSNRLIGNFALTYDIVDWIKFTARLGINNTWGNGKNWRARVEYDPITEPYHDNSSSFVEDSEFQSEIYNADALFAINRSFSDAFTMKLNLGATVKSQYYRGSLIRADNLSIAGFYDISNYTGQLDASVRETQQREGGVFGDMTLGYNNYLFLNLSGRQDWTSTLSAGNNSYFYPAVGVSFVPTDAIPALNNNNILSDAKITVSNSTVYTAFNPYAINERYYQSSGFPFGDVNGFYLSSTAVDAGISKEKLNTTEFGLNLSFLKGRITFDGSYYMTKTTDLITYTSPSVASGASNFLTNIGELDGRGLELALNGTVINKGGFKWNIFANLTNYETTVTRIKKDLTEIELYGTGQYGVYAVVGQVFPQIKANVYERDPQGRIVVDPVSGHPLEADSLANLGRTTPKYIVAMGTNVSYKGFTLAAVADYRTGHVYYEEGSDVMEFTGRSMESVSANRQDFIIPNSVIETSPGVYAENTNVAVQGGRQSYWTDVYNNVKSNYIKDATALKIRELSLSYTLPKKIIDKLPLQKVTVGFIARNLKTWLPEENRFSDPEFQNHTSRGGISVPGNAIGLGGYMQSPPTRSFGFNLNVEF